MDIVQPDVLKALYKQQQSTCTTLRERMTQISASTISVLIVINGWLISASPNLSHRYTGMLVLFIAIMTSVAIYGIKARYEEFRTVAKMIVRVEIAMKVYQPNYYLPNETLYDPKHLNLGNKDYQHGHHILWSPVAMLIIMASLTIALAVLANQ